MDAHYRIASIDNPVWRNLLFKLFDEDSQTRETGYNTLHNKLKFAARPENDLWVPPEDGARIIAISMQQPFPRLKEVWQRPAREILDWFLGLSHPLIAKTIHESYASSPTDIQSSALTFLASQKDARSFGLIAKIVKQHGLPSSLSDDFFRHLGDAAQHGNEVIGALILHSDDHIDEVLSYTEYLIETGHLQAAQLEPILPALSKHLEMLLDSMLSLEEFDDQQLFQTPENVKLRSQLKDWLSLLACLPSVPESITDLGEKLRDPSLLLALLGSLLAHGIPPSDQLIDKISASNRVRADFFTLLTKHQCLELYPSHFHNFEAFAACDMASWLAHPVELGCEPEQLTLMSRLIGEDKNQKSQWFLWRFSDDSEEFSAISGPYPLNPDHAPVQGHDTFSCFNLWHEASPEQHFDIIVRKLFSWRIETLAPFPNRANDTRPAPSNRAASDNIDGL